MSGRAGVCDACAGEWEAWLHFRPVYVAQFTVTDKPADLARLNHDRWAQVVASQQNLIARICEGSHHAAAA